MAGRAFIFQRDKIRKFKSAMTLHVLTDYGTLVAKSPREVPAADLDSRSDASKMSGGDARERKS